MIASILGIYKMVSGFIGAYKWIMAAVAIAGLVTTVFVYIGNHGEMKAALVAQNADLMVCADTNVQFAGEIGSLNMRIRESNDRRRVEIAAAQEILEMAASVVAKVRKENAELKLDLGVTRFETLEAIRDDENFADWVDWNVPAAGWRLLRDAAEGSVASD